MLTLLKIIVDIHSVLKLPEHVLSIVFMRNLKMGFHAIRESYRYVSDKRVALSSRVVTRRYILNKSHHSLCLLGMNY